ncbi:MAG: ester cyclase [Acidobacteria bacterium]|nr:ester cyclase [Acidobacteriota bacterium]
MSTAENKAAARRIYETLNEALATGNLQLLDNVIAPDAVDHNPAPGQAVGLEGIKQAFATFRASFPDLRFTIEDMIAEADKVACRITVRGTHSGDFQGIGATSRPVLLSGIDILLIGDGKIIERWGEFDNLSLLQQLGISPSRTG